MRLGGVIRELDVSRDAVLTVEKKGLVVAQRDWNGHRRYTRADVEDLRRLLKLPAKRRVRTATEEAVG